MERRAADVIEAVTRTGLKYEENERRVNMCQAIQEMREEERFAGEKEGIDKANRLSQILINEKRYDDLERSTRDPKYQKHLFREYNI